MVPLRMGPDNYSFPISIESLDSQSHDHHGIASFPQHAFFHAKMNDLIDLALYQNCQPDSLVLATAESCLSKNVGSPES